MNRYSGQWRGIRLAWDEKSRICIIVKSLNMLYGYQVITPNQLTIERTLVTKVLSRVVIYSIFCNSQVTLVYNFT